MFMIKSENILKMFFDNLKLKNNLWYNISVLSP